MFDVEDEYAESDIPTTLIRSKADCPGIEVRVIASSTQSCSQIHCTGAAG